MPYFTYTQNNSGGAFIINDQVTVYVIIEAMDANQANFLAETHGIYFDGCETGSDCECCGDRWNRAWKDEGEDEPSLYGLPLERHNELRTQFRWTTPGDAEVIIYHIDGRIEKIIHEKEGGAT